MAAKAKQRKLSRELAQIKEIRAAIEYGIDIFALIDNLKRTPAERMRRHQMALDTVEKLRKAKRV